jgi:hypothetical protein
MTPVLALSSATVIFPILFEKPLSSLIIKFSELRTLSSELYPDWAISFATAPAASMIF